MRLLSRLGKILNPVFSMLLLCADIQVSHLERDQEQAFTTRKDFNEEFLTLSMQTLHLINTRSPLLSVNCACHLVWYPVSCAVEWVLTGTSDACRQKQNERKLRDFYWNENVLIQVEFENVASPPPFLFHLLIPPPPLETKLPVWAASAQALPSCKRLRSFVASWCRQSFSLHSSVQRDGADEGPSWQRCLRQRDRVPRHKILRKVRAETCHSPLFELALLLVRERLCWHLCLITQPHNAPNLIREFWNVRKRTVQSQSSKTPFF